VQFCVVSSNYYVKVKTLYLSVVQPNTKKPFMTVEFTFKKLLLPMFFGYSK